MISEINWIELQNKYDYEKISERDLCLFYRISTSRLGRAKKKGLFKTRDKLELKNIISSKSTNRKHTEETKNKLSEIRKKYLLENPDKVPYLLNHSSKESYPEKYFTEVFKNERKKAKEEACEREVLFMLQLPTLIRFHVSLSKINGML